MKCKDFKKLITIKMYGELTDMEKEDLSQHIQECQSCSALAIKAEFLKESLPNDAAIPFPDWERSWQLIKTKIHSKEKSRNLSYPYRKWIYAASVLIVVFLVGFWAGKQGLFQTSSDPDSTNNLFAPQQLSPLNRYAEKIDSILIRLNNKSHHHTATDLTEIEDAMIKDLLIRTRMLKDVASRKNIKHMTQLFEDLELILIGFSNLNPEDRQTANYLSYLIKDKRVQFKLKSFLNQGTNL